MTDEERGFIFSVVAVEMVRAKSYGYKSVRFLEAMRLYSKGEIKGMKKPSAIEVWIIKLELERGGYI